MKLLVLTTSLTQSVLRLIEQFRFTSFKGVQLIYLCIVLTWLLKGPGVLFEIYTMQNR